MRLFQSMVQRRSFVTRFSAGATALAATFGSEAAQTQSRAAARWAAERHEQDDWMDKIPGKHRLVFDATTPERFGYAMLFASNYFIANQDSYGLKDSDLAVVIIARHHATPFAFNDAMWKKYGTKISELADFVDPRTKKAATSNLYNLPSIGLPNKGASIDDLVEHGVHFAVCEMATRGLAGSLAAAVGADDEDGAFTEISANLISNSHLVPAGIVTVNRAQERGYSFVNA